MPLKIDMHVHTRHSYDGFITPEELNVYSRRQGLDGVAITDHDTVDGWREFSETSLLIIPGVEITTKQGHVLAVDVSNTVKAGLSFGETIDRIHDAGGLAIAAHPTAYFKGFAEEEFDEKFDAVEVINSSAVPFSYSVRKNRKLAVTHGLPQTGGSDAHIAVEVGAAYTVVNAERDVDKVVEAIRRGAVTPLGGAIPWRVRLRREFLSIKKKWTGAL